MTTFSGLIDQAKAKPIERVAPAGFKRRGGELVGPCQLCGKGTDRCWFNTKTNRWGNRCSCCPVESGDNHRLGDISSWGLQ
jgi:hypothetical protein